MWAKVWLGISILIAIGMIFFAVKSFDVLKDNPDFMKESKNYIQWIVTRIAVISVIYGAALWSAKNYKINRHLFVVNQHRSSALRTFEAFIVASSDEETKNAILLEATHCIFAHSNTGFLGKDEELPANRIIEILKPFGKNAGGSS